MCSNVCLGQACRAQLWAVMAAAKACLHNAWWLLRKHARALHQRLLPKHACCIARRLLQSVPHQLLHPLAPVRGMGATAPSGRRRTGVHRPTPSHPCAAAKASRPHVTAPAPALSRLRQWLAQSCPNPQASWSERLRAPRRLASCLWWPAATLEWTWTRYRCTPPLIRPTT